MIVRLATHDDIAAIVRMGQDFASTPGYAGKVRLEPDMFTLRLEAIIGNPDGFLAVLEGDDGVCGSIAGFIAPSMFASVRHAAELFWFVDPVARGNGQGRKLFDALFDWVKASDAVSFNMIEPPDAPEVGALYEKYGFTKFETYWNMPCR
jgi:RimJ/RimL family protein N-acetyltransferase